MPLPPDTISPRRHAETFVLLAALVLMAYANSFGIGFPWDNGPLILNDPRVHAVSLHNIRNILTHGYWWPSFESGLYRPLTTLSFLLNFALLNGLDQPAGYHAVNCLLHAAAAFLVYRLVLRLVGQYWPAFLAAALWALHPIATEAVTNIIGRADELAAIGVLGTLLFHIQATEETGRRRILYLGGMTMAATLAVFSKENGVVALALVALYDFTYRLPRGGSWLAAGRQFSRFFRESYAWLAIPMLAMLGARWAVLRHSGAMEIPFVDNPLSGADWLTRASTAIRITGKYLGLLAWPRTLSIDYSYNQVPVWSWNSARWEDAVAAAALLGLMLLTIICYRRSRTGFFLLGWGALTLLPASNLLVTTGTIMAERLLYLPSVAFAAALTIAVYSLAARARLRPIVAVAPLLLIGAAYGARTYQRNPDWQDNQTLFASTVTAAPDSFKTHMGLANAWMAEDPGFREGERAVGEAEKAVAIVSGLPDGRIATNTFVLLGAIYYARADSLAHKDAAGNPMPDQAVEEWYRKALATDLRAVAIDRAQNENHRRAELARGTPAGEIGLAGLPDVYGNLGNAWLRLGDPGQALEAFRYQQRLAPASPLTYSNLASAYQAQQRPQDAVTSLLEGLAVSDSPLLLSRVAELYRGMEGGSCAMTGEGEDRTVNRNCPLVRSGLCKASRDLTAALRAVKMDEMADRIRHAAGGELVCQ